MIIFKSFIAIVFFSLVFAACCTCDTININHDALGKLQQKADEFVISKTGKEFFNKYIKPDYEKVTKIKDGYLMVYDFSIPDKEGIESEIRFSIDTLGNIKNDKEIIGIPNCKSNPDDCNFKISGKEAIIIAEQNGLEKGIKNWDVSFSWDTEHEKYLWQVRTTLKETKGEVYRGNGKIMLINPFNGTIVKTEEWRVN